VTFGEVTFGEVTFGEVTFRIVPAPQPRAG
jgi:hypothetical protein